MEVGFTLLNWIWLIEHFSVQPDWVVMLDRNVSISILLCTLCDIYNVRLKLQVPYAYNIQWKSWREVYDMTIALAHGFCDTIKRIYVWYFCSLLCFDKSIFLMGMFACNTLSIVLIDRRFQISGIRVPIGFLWILISKATAECIASSLIIDNRNVRLWSCLKTILWKLALHY